PRVLAGELDDSTSRILRPGDVPAPGGVEVNLEYVRQAAVRARDGRAEDPEGTDPAARRSVAVDRVGIEQDRVRRGRRRGVRGVRLPARVRRDRTCHLREA